MTHLDDEITRLARRISVARLGLSVGGPVELLDYLLGPVATQIEVVTEMLTRTEQPTFEPVDAPIGPATTTVLMDLISPVPPTREETP